MKDITIRSVDSISEYMEDIQNRIRVRAYEKFLARTGTSQTDLEDWLSAERELICILAPSLKAEEDRIIAQVEIPGGKSNLLELEIHADSQNVLLHAEIQDEPGPRAAFGVIRFPAAIDLAGLRAEYSKGVLRLTAPLSEMKRLKQTA